MIIRFLVESMTAHMRVVENNQKVKSLPKNDRGCA